MNTHDDLQKLKKNINLNLAVFKCMLAFLSFLILSVTDKDEPKSSHGLYAFNSLGGNFSWTKWQNILLRNSVLESHVNNISLSWIADFGGWIRCIGTIIDLENTDSNVPADMIWHLGWANIPVYLHFTKKITKQDTGSSCYICVTQPIHQTGCHKDRPSSSCSLFTNVTQECLHDTPTRLMETVIRCSWDDIKYCKFSNSLWCYKNEIIVSPSKVPSQMTLAFSQAHCLPKHKCIPLQHFSRPLVSGLVDNDCVLWLSWQLNVSQIFG